MGGFRMKGGGGKSKQSTMEEGGRNCSHAEGGRRDKCFEVVLKLAHFSLSHAEMGSQKVYR